MTLDFKHPDGRALLERLIAKADVLVENFRPGTLTQAGPRLRGARGGATRGWCTARSRGSGRPARGRKQPGYDAMMQAEGGLMSITGAADAPPVRLGVAIADIVSGMFAAYGVAMALLARERTGKGQQVDVAMLDATVGAADLPGRQLFRERQGRRRAWATGTRRIVPYETFTAADGEFVLAVGNDEQWRRFCRAARSMPGG